MIRLRTGTVTSVKESRAGLLELVVDVEGAPARALAYPELCGPVTEGDRVLLNTTAVQLGLGTGGFHLVLSVEGAAAMDPGAGGHVMKLRYTPLQAAVQTVEEQGSPHHAAMAEAGSLDGTPVVWVPLHSMVAPAVAGARAAGAGHVAYVMTDGASLPLWLSDQVHALRSAGLVDATITAGQALGGDLEAVTLFSALLAARTVAGADVIVAADGPGKVGTETPWGATDVASGLTLVAASILGGRAVAALRVSFSDPSYRHHGVSPHSLTVLQEVAVLPVHVAVPTLEGEERQAVWSAIRDARLEERHQVVEAPGAAALDLLRQEGVPLESMGRTSDEDPALFLGAGAAGVLAGRMAAGSERWRKDAGR